jgi:integrase
MKLKVPYLKWRNGRPRWEPGPALRDKGMRGRDLKSESGQWLPLDRAIEAATALNAEVTVWRASGAGFRRAPTPKKTQRSCRHLYEMWSATPEFSMLAASTRADYKVKAELFLNTNAGGAAFADVPVAALDHPSLKGFWRQAYKDRGHAMANGMIAVVRAMLSEAVALGWITQNPAYNLNLKSVAPRVAFWAPAKVSAFVETADRMGMASVADALIIAIHSGLRQADVLSMPPRIFVEDRVALSQMKTKALIDAPMTPALKGRVAEIKERWKMKNKVSLEAIVIDERTGSKYTADAFRKAFRKVRDEATACHPHLAKAERFQPALADLRYQDTRDTAVTRLAMAGCSLPQIAAITGHSPDHITSVIKHYLALNEAMADEAIRLLSHWLENQGIAL